ADEGVTSNMTNVVIVGNTFTGAKVGISFNIYEDVEDWPISLVNATVSYSRFADNTGNYQLFMNGTSRIIADYNWWGSNNGPQRNLISGVNINNYYTMSISTSVASLTRSFDENLAINYKFVLNGTNNVADAASKFSPFTVAIMVNNKLVSNIDGRKAIQFNVLLTGIDNTITAILNKESSIVKYKASKMTTALVVTNIKPLFNKKNTITVTARDKNGKLLDNKKVGLFVNNKQVATTTTNKAGVATFKYTFKTRKVHKVQVKLVEDTTHSKSNSKTLSLKPKDKTTTKLAKFSAKFKKKATLKATLKNHKNKAMAKKVVKFYVNKKYLGKAKTNTKGLATLTKKVPVKGLVNFIAKYAGDKTFHKSDASRKIKVK
ncbi:MAG: Ig-like domain-containing protein, partial [Methanobrevibacter sp.]|nr:Ig-like domain-containing protein [Methanobrevibacter sp.]